MISELVKGLRKLGNQWKHNDVTSFHLIFEAADTIEALSAKLARYNLGYGEWIPVSEALPSEGQVVLAIGDKGTWDVGIFRGTAEWTDDERMWWWKNKSTKRVEYWMPKDAIPLPNREDGER